MPYELFWHGPISAYLQFRAAHDKREKETIEEQNRVAWLNGAYIKRALEATYHLFNMHVKPSANPYPPEPLKPQKQLTQEEKEQQRRIIDKCRETNEKIARILEAKAHGGTDNRQP